MKNKVILLTSILITVVLSGCNSTTPSEAPKATASATINNLPTATPQVLSAESSKEKKMEIDAKKIYYAILKTSMGDIKIELNTKKTPLTSENFITLAQKNFYNNTIFHRVIKDFMIQGGDPLGTGSGGPGYKFNDEPFEGEYTRGTVAMANAGPNTNGSQFFIMHKDVPLPKNYVIFGKVVEGIEVVDKIATSPVTASATGENSKPVTPTKVNTVEILEK